MSYQNLLVADTGAIRTITINRPDQLNALNRDTIDELDKALLDADADRNVRVLIITGSGPKAFVAGADIKEFAHFSVAEGKALAADGQKQLFDHVEHLGKPVIAAVNGFALGGGFEMALMCDISVIARDTKLGMPATRFLGPALGSLHMFFHRLGPVLARRMLLTGDIIEAGSVEHLGIFTDTCDAGQVGARARYWAEKVSKMPADGVVIAKEAFRLVEQSQAYQGEEVASYLFHAYGTNLQFSPGEFNFVKTRARHGAKEAFRLRDEHFQVQEPH